MNALQLQEVIVACLQRIAPEANSDAVDPDVRFRDQFDFDSIDCLNLMAMLARELQLDIPAMDYPQLATLNGCLKYLLQRTADLAPPAADRDHRPVT